MATSPASPWRILSIALFLSFATASVGGGFAPAIPLTGCDGGNALALAATLLGAVATPAVAEASCALAARVPASTMPVPPALLLAATIPPQSGGCDPLGGAACATVDYDDVGPACSEDNDAVETAHGVRVQASVTDGPRQVVAGALWACVDSLTYYSESGPTIHQALILLFAYTLEDGVQSDLHVVQWFWVSVPDWGYDSCIVSVALAGSTVVDESCPGGMRPPNPPALT